MSDAVTARPHRPKKQRWWFIVHGWCSLPLWIFFSLICLTGTLASVSHELMWLSNPAARAESNGQPRQPLAALAQAVEQHVPHAHVQHVMVLEPYLITAVRFSSPQHPSALAYVNPYTAKVQSVETGPTLVEFLRSLHGWLLMPWYPADGGGYYSWGYFMVGMLSILILAASVTGLVIYKKFWRAVTRPRIRWSAPLRTVLGDLHRHVAVWCLWFLIIISLTGGWYLVQGILWQQGIEIDPSPTALPAEQLPAPQASPPTWIGLARAEHIAQQALPHVAWSLVSSPEHHRDYYRFSGQGAGVLFDSYSYTVWVDPWQGRVVKTYTPSDMNTTQTLTHIADPLHYGTIGGLTTKLIWCLAGLCLLGLCVTGFIIWWQRTRKETRHLWATWRLHQRIGYRARYLINGAILVLPVYYLIESLNPTFPTAWATKPLGALTATPTPHNSLPAYHGADGWLKDFGVTFCAGCSGQIRQAWLNAGPTPLATPPRDWGNLHGSPFGLEAHAPYPKRPSAQDRLWLSVQLWNGTVLRQQWPLPNDPRCRDQ
ncbi:MAG: hypothetical protein RL180_335 [Pseudomonadota bacterium]|jgi:uncharacterized iron-regulated membrane protein